MHNFEDFTEQTKKELHEIADLLDLSKQYETVQEFDVRVNDVLVVGRTGNPDALRDVASKIKDNTNKVQLRMYNGKSSNHEPKEFVRTNQQLNGFGLTENQIRSKLSKEIKEKQYLQNLEEKVKELEEENEELRNVNLGGINVPDALTSAAMPLFQGLLEHGINYWTGLKTQQQAVPQLTGVQQDEFLIQLNELIQTLPDTRKQAIIASFKVLSEVPSDQFNQFIQFMNDNYFNQNPNENA